MLNIAGRLELPLCRVSLLLLLLLLFDRLSYREEANACWPAVRDDMLAFGTMCLAKLLTQGLFFGRQGFQGIFGGLFVDSVAPAWRRGRVLRHCSGQVDPQQR